MKTFIIIFLLSSGLLRAQILKVTSKGLTLVQDSISNTRITNEFYSNYKGKFKNYISNDTNWMSKNSGKYLLPTIEADSFIVLEIENHWGAVKINGEEKASFGFKYPMDFFKKGKCYGFQNIGMPGAYQLMGEEDAYKNNYRIKNLEGEVLVNYSELIDTYKNSFLLLGKSPDKCGIINTEMDTILSFQYSCTSWDAKNFYFSENGYIALKDITGKCGVVNHMGKVLIPFEYDYIADIDDFGDNRIIIEKGNKTGELDKNLNWVVKIE